MRWIEKQLSFKSLSFIYLILFKLYMGSHTGSSKSEMSIIGVRTASSAKSVTGIVYNGISTKSSSSHSQDSCKMSVFIMTMSSLSLLEAIRTVLYFGIAFCCFLHHYYTKTHLDYTWTFIFNMNFYVAFFKIWLEDSMLLFK